MSLIDEYQNGHWSARFANGPFPGCFGGQDAFAVMWGLLANSPTRHLTLDEFEPDLRECRSDRVEMVLADRWDHCFFIHFLEKPPPAPWFHEERGIQSVKIGMCGRNWIAGLAN